MAKKQQTPRRAQKRAAKKEEEKNKNIIPTVDNIQPVDAPAAPETQPEDILKRIDDKDFSFYFFTLDTKGNPVAGVANIYEYVKTLADLGCNAHILHEKNDYKLKGDEEGMGITEWLGEEYAALSHVSIEAQQLNVGPADYIIIPEIFSNVMDQVKSFRCKKMYYHNSGYVCGLKKDTAKEILVKKQENLIKFEIGRAHV